MTVKHLQDEIDGFSGVEAFHLCLKLALLYEFEVEDVIDEGQEQVDLRDDQHDDAARMLAHDITEKALQEDQADVEWRAELRRHAKLVVH